MSHISPSEVRKKKSRGVDLAKPGCQSIHSELYNSPGSTEEAVL